MRYKLGNYVFARKVDAVKYIRDILHTHPRNVPISDLVVYALLFQHPNVQEKVGLGIKSIVIRTNSYGNAPGFYIKRVDGSEIDFSYKHCFTPRTHKSDVRKAMRTEIIKQIHHFRDANFHGCCEVTGEKLTREEVHIDHESPLFFELVDRFLNCEQVSIKDVSIDSIGETAYLSDSQLADRWRAFHKKYAVLRCVSKQFNLSRRNEHWDGGPHPDLKAEHGLA